ncbi:MAG: cytochrome c [Verrucomicrobia bacterium]|nr:cytochrome c [Verrucomicrobiota bacterium]
MRSVLTESPTGRVILVFVVYLAIGVLVFVSPGRTKSEPEPSHSAIRGSIVWRRENCLSCHAIYGLGGHSGPDIVNIVSLYGDAYVRHVVTNGMIAMPAFELPEHEVDDLAAYLQHLDSTGVYPIRKKAPPVFGEIR